MPKYTDHDIITALKKGDNKTVLSFLYAEVLPLVINHVRKLSGNKQEAQDIFQDAIIIFYKKVKRNEFTEGVNVTAFVFHVCKNLWINRVKKKSRMVELQESSDFDAGENFLDELMSEERKTAILKCFEELGEDCKKLLKYSVYDRLSMKEICERLGYSSEDVAKTYNYRCKQKLLTIVKKYRSIVNLVRE